MAALVSAGANALQFSPGTPNKQAKITSQPQGVVAKTFFNKPRRIRAAFYVTWDPAAFSSLQAQHHSLDWLFPEWLHVTAPDGRLRAVDDAGKAFNVVEASGVRSVDTQVTAFLKEKRSRTKIFPLVNNHDPVSKQWRSEAANFLIDPEARRTFRREAMAFLKAGKYAGLTLDFEQMGSALQPGFRKLVAELATDLHAQKLRLFVAVPVEDSSYDYRGLARHADAVILMMYDQHHEAGPPGPVASQDFFVKNLKAALKWVPKSKLMCAIGNYGYEWTIKEGSASRARSFTVQEAWRTAQMWKQSIEMDGDSLNPHATFTDADRLRHDLWFLDAVTALNQMRTANRLGLNAFALWRLGAEDPSLWSVWTRPEQKAAEQRLQVIPASTHPNAKGNVAAPGAEPAGQPVTRTLTMDPRRGLIVRQRISLP